MKTRQWRFNYEEGAEYISCPLDEKNMPTDWLEEFFFDGNCGTNNDWNQIAGYGYIEGEQYLCECGWDGATVTWTFLHMNYQEADEIEDFAKNLKEYLSDMPQFAFTVTAVQHDKLPDSFTNQIIVRFEHKVE